MQLRYLIYKNGCKSLQYREEARWVDGSTTANGRWVLGEWKDVREVYKDDLDKD